MQFSAKAEYACLAMLELAAQHGSPKPVRLVELAEKHGIPPRFLVQILLQLKGSGLVHSTRGASGGYHLARPPQEISLADILNTIDRADPATNGTRSGQRVGAEVSTLTNTLRGVWERIQRSRQQILEQTNLAELVEAGQGLQYVI